MLVLTNPWPLHLHKVAVLTRAQSKKANMTGTGEDNFNDSFDENVSGDGSSPAQQLLQPPQSPNQPPAGVNLPPTGNPLQETVEFLQTLGLQVGTPAYLQMFQTILQQKNSEAQLANAKEQRAHELQLKNQELLLKQTEDATAVAASKNAAAAANRAPVPPVVAFNPDLERADAFVRRFETHCTRHNVPKDSMVDLFVPLIPTKDSLVIFSLEPTVRYDWDHVKSVFLRQHVVTTAQKRKDFLESHPEYHDTAVTYIKSLRKYHSRDPIPQDIHQDLQEPQDSTEALLQEQSSDDPPEEVPSGVAGYDPLQELLVGIAVAVEDPEDPELDPTDPCLPTKTLGNSHDIHLGDLLTKEQQQNARILLQKYDSTFSEIPGRTNVLEHRIELSHDGPLRLQHSYPMPMALGPALKEEIDKCLQLGVIEPSQSPYCSPLLAVRKKDGTHRFCLDCRQLNSQTKFDLEPIPHTQEIFANLSKAKWFSKFDLTAGYWQVPLEENSKQLTAFRTKYGLYHFCVMPFGLVNAPATFSRLMRTVTEGLPDVHVYLDDVLVASADWQSHLHALEQLFKALEKANLRAKPSKCEIGQRSLEYLGHAVSEGECRPLEDKVTAIAKTPLPKTRTELRSFLGAVGYYQQFVKNFAALREPLDAHLKNREPDTVQWTDKSVQAFNVLRSILIKPPVLQLYNPDEPVVLRTDASNTGLGAVLFQAHRKDPRTLAPVVYASRTLRSAEKNYSTIEKEALAVYWSLKKFHVYLYGRQFTLQTDHQPLTYFNQADKLNPRLKRWALYMTLYRFYISYIKGKDNHLPDLLSRCH